MDKSSVETVECRLCHYSEDVTLEPGECAEGGIECQVCDRGSMFPISKENENAKHD